MIHAINLMYEWRGNEIRNSSQLKKNLLFQLRNDFKDS